MIRFRSSVLIFLIFALCLANSSTSVVLQRRARTRNDAGATSTPAERQTVALMKPIPTNRGSSQSESPPTATERFLPIPASGHKTTQSPSTSSLQSNSIQDSQTPKRSPITLTWCTSTNQQRWATQSPRHSLYSKHSRDEPAWCTFSKTQRSAISGSNTQNFLDPVSHFSHPLAGAVNGPHNLPSNDGTDSSPLEQAATVDEGSPSQPRRRPTRASARAARNVFRKAAESNVEEGSEESTVNAKRRRTHSPSYESPTSSSSDGWSERTRLSKERVGSAKSDSEIDQKGGQHKFRKTYCTKAQNFA